jgi:hypothetical protein
MKKVKSVRFPPTGFMAPGSPAEEAATVPTQVLGSLTEHLQQEVWQPAPFPSLSTSKSWSLHGDAQEADPSAEGMWSQPLSVWNPEPKADDDDDELLSPAVLVEGDALSTSEELTSRARRGSSRRRTPFQRDHRPSEPNTIPSPIHAQADKASDESFEWAYSPQAANASNAVFGKPPAQPATPTVSAEAEARIVRALGAAASAGVSEAVLESLSSAALRGDTLAVLELLSNARSGVSLSSEPEQANRGRSPSVVAVLHSQHGRRVKVVKMGGQELWRLEDTRGKLTGLAMLCRFAKQCRMKRVVTVMRMLGLLKSMGDCSRRGRRAIKALSLGVLVGAPRRRIVRRCAPVLLAVGIVASSLNWVRDERIRRARAALAKEEKARAKAEASRAKQVKQINWSVIKEDDVAEDSMWARRASDAQHVPDAASANVSDLMERVTDTFSRRTTQPKAAVAPREAKPSRVKLIQDDGARKLISIGAGSALRGVTMEQIAQAIAEMDVEKLGGVESAEALLNMAPAFSDAIIRDVLGFTGDVEKLDLPERFVLECVARVPLAQEKLRVMVSSGTMSESLAFVIHRSEGITEVCREIKASTRFRFLLRDVIVPLGNQLNSGTKYGGATGVRIDSLNTLVQTRSGSGQSFLRFVVEGLLSSEDGVELLQMVDDFPTLCSTATAFFTWMPIRAEVGLLAEGLQAASKLSASPELRKEPKLRDRVVEIAGMFEHAVSEGKSALSAAERSFSRLCTFLGLAQDEMQPEELFAHVKAFVQLVANETNATIALLERKKRQEAREAAKATALTAPPPPRNTNVHAKDDEEPETPEDAPDEEGEHEVEDTVAPLFRSASVPLDEGGSFSPPSLQHSLSVTWDSGLLGEVLERPRSLSSSTPPRPRRASLLTATAAMVLQRRGTTATPSPPGSSLSSKAVKRLRASIHSSMQGSAGLHDAVRAMMSASGSP